MWDHPLVFGQELVHLYIGGGRVVVVEVSAWLIVFFFAAVLLFAVWKWKGFWPFRRYELVSVNVELGGVGKVELRPNNEDIQIAHRIWTELVTRKAALPIDTEDDVIVEIYDSWYALFGRVRQLISDIPGQLLRKEESTQKLVTIATQTLNNGLRPHLTHWQARFRNWYSQHAEDLRTKTPQEVQRAFPQYSLLIDDMKKVNAQLIQYARELDKIIHGTR
jgi:hypothetical protein